MTYTNIFRVSFAFLSAFGLLACGGNVTTGTSNTGGAGGEAGGSTSSTSSGGAGGVGGTSSVGGAGGGTSSVGGAGGGSCEGLDQVGCLAAYPSCVPVYDDECCPSCDPGPCADCTSIQYHHCIPINEGCGDLPPSCGFVPDWACAGSEANCNIDPQGSPAMCATVAGCVVSYCNLDIDCNQDPVCVPVTGDMCGELLCDGIPPPCPDGTTNEVKNGCYTMSCLPLDLCGP